MNPHNFSMLIIKAAFRILVSVSMKILVSSHPYLQLTMQTSYPYILLFLLLVLLVAESLSLFSFLEFSGESVLHCEVETPSLTLISKTQTNDAVLQQK